MSVKWFEELKSLGLEEVLPLDFYRDVFPEGSLQEKASLDENGNYNYDDVKGKYCGIAIEITNKIRNGKPIIYRYSIIAPRYGKCIDVLTGSIILNDIVPDTKEFLLNQDFNMTYHGVNDFLLYMDETGKIKRGVFNTTFTKNAMKTMFLKISKDDETRREGAKKLNFIIDGTKDKTKQQNPFRYFHHTCTKKQQFGKKTTEIELSEIKYKMPANISLSRVLSEYVDYRLIPDEERKNKEVGRFTIGQLCNIKELAGIKGGKTATVDKLEEDSETMLEKVLEEKDNTNTTNNKLNKGYKNLKYAVRYHGGGEY